jgi:ABC-type iron transport system FetAB permease component
MEEEIPNNKRNVKVKEGDGGFWSALTSFILLIIFFIARATFAAENTSIKLALVSFCFVFAMYASYRKVRFHDYSHRHLWTDVFIWLCVAFSLPLIIIYLFFS